MNTHLSCIDILNLRDGVWPGNAKNLPAKDDKEGKGSSKQKKVGPTANQLRDLISYLWHGSETPTSGLVTASDVIIDVVLRTPIPDGLSQEVYIRQRTALKKRITSKQYVSLRQQIRKAVNDIYTRFTPALARQIGVAEDLPPIFLHYVQTQNDAVILFLVNTPATREAWQAYRDHNRSSEVILRTLYESVHLDERTKTALQTVVQSLRRVMGELHGVPRFPYVPVCLEKSFEALQQALLRPLDSTTVSAVGLRASRVVVLHGFPGTGKTVLATSLCYDAEVRREFKDGIIWVDLGIQPNIVERQREIVCALNGNMGSLDPNPDINRNYLTQLFRNKKCLLVLDDAWSKDDVESFGLTGLQGCTLITSRAAQVFQCLFAEEISISPPRTNEALQILALWARIDSNHLPSESFDVVREFGGLPLALAFCGGMIRGGMPWTTVLSYKKNCKLDRIRRELPRYDHSNLVEVLAASVNALPRKPLHYKEFLLDLVVFPRGTPIPRSLLRRYWGERGLLEEDADEILLELTDRGLINGVGNDHFTLHDLMHDYLNILAKDSLTKRHTRLLALYAKQCSDTPIAKSKKLRNVDWSLGPNDGYFFETLFYHLCATRQHNIARQLLFEPRWLWAKLKATHVLSMIRDCSYCSNDTNVQRLSEALMQASLSIQLDHGQLPGQLLGRLKDQGNPRLARFRERLKTWPQFPCILVHSATLTTNTKTNGKLIVSSFDELTCVGSGLHINEIVTGSTNGALYHWDLELLEGTAFTGRATARIASVSTCANNNWILTLDTAGEICHWDAIARVIVGPIILPFAGRCIALCSERARAVVLKGNSIVYYDLLTNKIIREAQLPQGDIKDATISADGSVFLAVLDTGDIILWCLSENRGIERLPTGQPAHPIIAAAERSKFALLFPGTEIVQIWNGKTATLEREFSIPMCAGEGYVYKAGISHAAFSDAKDTIFFAHGINLHRHFPKETEKRSPGFWSTLPHVQILRLLYEGQLLVSISKTGVIQTWRTDDPFNSDMRTALGELGLANPAISSDGSLAVSIDFSGLVRVWNVSCGKETAHFCAFHEKEAMPYHFSTPILINAIGSRVISVAGVEPGSKKVFGEPYCLWNTETHKVMGNLPSSVFCEGDAAPTRFCSLSSDGGLLLYSQTDDNQNFDYLCLMDIVEGGSSVRLAYSRDRWHAMAISHNGNWVVGCTFNCVVVFDLERWEKTDHLVLEEFICDYASISDDGKTILLWHAILGYILWDRVNNRTSHLRHIGSGFVSEIRMRNHILSENGNICIDVVEANCLRAWSTRAERAIAHFRFHVSIDGFACTPNAMQMVVKDEIGTIHCMSLINAG